MWSRQIADVCKPSVFIFLSSLLVYRLGQCKKSILDLSTLLWHHTTPLVLQNHLRDNGTFKHVADMGAFFIGVCLCTLQYGLAGRHRQLQDRLQSFPYGPSARHFVEIFAVPIKNNEIISESYLRDADSNRLLVFVHGGAWGSGQVWHYRMVAEGLARLMGMRAVAMVGYPVYPCSTVLEQSQCVTAALQFIRSEGSPARLALQQMGAAESAVVLAGHSSGANICALAMLRALESESASLPSDGVREGVCGTVHCREDATAFTDVCALVGLAGVYDVVKHFQFEAARGVHEVSPMGAAAGGPANFWRCSPTILARKLRDELGRRSCSGSNCRSGDEKMPPEGLSSSVDGGGGGGLRSLQLAARVRCVLVHGTRDGTVPHTSSEEFARELRALGFAAHVELVDCDHVEPVLDMVTAHSRPTPASAAVLSAWRLVSGLAEADAASPSAAAATEENKMM